MVLEIGTYGFEARILRVWSQKLTVLELGSYRFGARRLQF